MQCPDEQTLRLFLSAQLNDEETELIDRHLERCDKCTERVDEVEKELQIPLMNSIKAVKIKSWSVESDNIEDDSEPLPETIGGYKILGLLGQGGMGTVYEGVHPRLSRRVAIKVIRKNRVSNPASNARFQREIHAIGKLASPYVVQAFDAGETEGRPYIVMELLEGCDLAQYVEQKGPLSLEETCDIIEQICQGLQCIHQNGFVHRDIKLSNLWMTPDKKLKILDLGLSRLQDNESSGITSHKTESGFFVGTPDYASPEQICGNKIDYRSDIYSLGCVFFALLTSHPPFTNSNYPQVIDKIAAHARDRTPSLKLFRKDIPDAVEAILQKMTAKRPEDRFQDVSEIVFPIQGNAVKLPKRYLFQQLFIAGIVVIFLASFLIFHVIRQSSKPLENTVRTTDVNPQGKIGTSNNVVALLPDEKEPFAEEIVSIATKEEKAEREEVSIHPDDEKISKIITPEAATNTLSPKIVFQSDSSFTPLSLRKDAWKIKNTIYVPSAEHHYASFLEGGRKIIIVDSKGHMGLFDASTLNEIRNDTLKNNSLVTAFALSPDNKLFAVGQLDGTVTLFDVETGAVFHSYKMEDDYISSMCFSHDSKKFFSFSRIIDIVDLESQKHDVHFDTVKKRNPFHEPYQFEAFSYMSPYASCFSPDGSFVLYTIGLAFFKFDIREQKVFRYAEMRSEQGLQPLTLPGDRTSSIVLSPQLNCFAVARKINSVLLCQDERFKLLCQDKRLNIEFESFPDQDLPVSGKICSLAFSPNGRFLLTGGIGVDTSLWDLDASRVIFTFPKDNQADTVVGLDFSKDGTKILIQMKENSIISVWDYYGDDATLFSRPYDSSQEGLHHRKRSSKNIKSTHSYSDGLYIELLEPIPEEKLLDMVHPGYGKPDKIEIIDGKPCKEVWEDFGPAYTPLSGKELEEWEKNNDNKTE